MSTADIFIGHADEWVYQPASRAKQDPCALASWLVGNLGNKLERAPTNKRQLKPIDWSFQAGFSY